MAMLLKHLKRDALGHRCRRFSSSLIQRQPYLILGGDFVGGNLMTGDHAGFLTYYDPCKGEVKVSEKIVSMGLLELMGRFGSSHGWVASLNVRDGTMSLHDDLNPSTRSKPLPESISLPPLVPLPYCQTQLVTNVAMSSSPEQEDCVVAVKFSGPQLSLCRPGGSKWFNIRTPSSFFASRVMFSERDQMFRMLTSGGYCMGSWDLHKHRHNPKLKELRFCNVPELVHSEWELLDSCFRREELVEHSPTGESFLVKWYSGGGSNSDSLAKLQTKRIMVFKIDEEGNACYIEDIGDLCIFLSSSEPFCLSASLYSGLTPNSVYFVGSDIQDVGVWNLATSTIHPTIPPHDCPSTAPPFWLQN